MILGHWSKWTSSNSSRLHQKRRFLPPAFLTSQIIRARSSRGALVILPGVAMAYKKSILGIIAHTSAHLPTTSNEFQPSYSYNCTNNATHKCPILSTILQKSCDQRQSTCVLDPKIFTRSSSKINLQGRKIKNWNKTQTTIAIPIKFIFPISCC